MSSAYVGVVQMWEMYAVGSWRSCCEVVAGASREFVSESSADDLQEAKTLFEPLLRPY